jgi:hypothetical protein
MKKCIAGAMFGLLFILQITIAMKKKEMPETSLSLKEVTELRQAIVDYKNNRSRIKQEKIINQYKNKYPNDPFVKAKMNEKSRFDNPVQSQIKTEPVKKQLIKKEPRKKQPIKKQEKSREIKQSVEVPIITVANLEEFKNVIEKEVNDLEEVIGGMGYNYTYTRGLADYAYSVASKNNIPLNQAADVVVDLLVKRGLKDLDNYGGSVSENTGKNILKEVQETVSKVFNISLTRKELTKELKDFVQNLNKPVVMPKMEVVESHPAANIIEFKNVMKKEVDDLEEVIGGMGFNYYYTDIFANDAKKEAIKRNISLKRAADITIDLLVERAIKDGARSGNDILEEVKKVVLSAFNLPK